MDWKTCINEGNAISVSVNKERVKSLVKSAKNLVEFIENVKTEEKNASILLKNMYEAVLELLHAYLLSKGYKVLNHLCIGYYLRDQLENREYFYVFDRYRKIRNSVVYYGENVDIETAKKGLKELKGFFDKIEGLIFL